MSTMQLAALQWVALMACVMTLVVTIEAVVKKPASGCNQKQATRNTTRNTHS